MPLDDCRTIDFPRVHDPCETDSRARLEARSSGD